MRSAQEIIRQSREHATRQAVVRAGKLIEQRNFRRRHGVHSRSFFVSQNAGEVIHCGLHDKPAYPTSVRIGISPRIRDATEAHKAEEP